MEHGVWKMVIGVEFYQDVESKTKKQKNKSKNKNKNKTTIIK